jgi:hypothetical protein
MVACPRCHFMNPVKQKACQACGTALPYASSPSNERPVAGRPTLRGMRSPESANSQSMPAARADAPPGLLTSDQTMPSMVSPTPEQIRSHRANNTLLGHVSPAELGAAPESRAEVPSSRAPVSPAPTTGGFAAHLRAPVNPGPARGGVSRQATLLGHAPLSEARRPTAVSRSSTSQTMPSMQAVRSDTPSTPTPDKATDEDGDPAPAALVFPSQPAPPEEQRITPHDHPGRTYFAVTAASVPPPPSDTVPPTSQPPSLAYPALGSPPPLPTRRSGHPEPLVSPQLPAAHSVRPLGESKTLPSTTAPYDTTVSPNVPPVSISPIAPSRVSLRAVQSRLGRRVLALTALLGGGLLLFSWMWQPATPVSGQINASDATPALSVLCHSCADGSRVEFEGQHAEFHDNRATLSLATPPQVGANTFALQIYRSGMGRDETVQLQVEVDYKARWNLGGLTAKPPHLDVEIEAAPGVSAKVDDVDVALDSNRGIHRIELGQPVQGANRSVEWLEKSVEVATRRGAGAPSTASPFQIRLPIVPLTVDTPWSSFQTDAASVVLSGRTSPKATVTSPESSTQADADGYFELRVTPQSGVNAVEVVASAPGHAPRSSTTSFVQVANLTPIALAYQHDAVRRFDLLTERLIPGAKPVPVALAGKVQEWKTSHNLTVLLVAVSSGCPSRSCLVRVEYPAVVDFTPNQAVSVFGDATLSPPGIGPLPHVQSHFILR